MITTKLMVINHCGIHAGPSAKIAYAASHFKSDIAIQYMHKKADAKNILAISTLDVPHGGEITVYAEGVDAELAIEAITEAVKEGFGEE